MKNKILVAILGKSGSGKDSLITEICRSPKINFQKIIPYTTRPRRDYEKEGQPYHFITAIEFANMLLDGRFIEATVFNTWCYGSAKPDCEFSIGAYNPEAFDCLREYPDKDLTILPYYLVADDKIRLIRQLEREEHPHCYEIARRFLADEEDFTEIETDNTITPLISNTWGDCYDNAEKIIQDVVKLTHLDHNM